MVDLFGVESLEAVSLSPPWDFMHSIPETLLVTRRCSSVSLTVLKVPYGVVVGEVSEEEEEAAWWWW